MTWIRTVPLAQAGKELLEALEKQRALYPAEYMESTHPPPPGSPPEVAGIVGAHTLLPDALYHAFATFGVLMAPDLPLTRRQHEMITTVVSTLNRCLY